MVVSTHLKNISQIGSFPQIGVKIKNIWNHHPDVFDLPRIYQIQASHTATKLPWSRERIRDDRSHAVDAISKGTKTEPVIISGADPTIYNGGLKVHPKEPNSFDFVGKSKNNLCEEIPIGFFFSELNFPKSQWLHE